MSRTIGTGPCGLAVFDDYIDSGARHSTLKQRSIEFCDLFGNKSEMRAGFLHAIPLVKTLLTFTTRYVGQALEDHEPPLPRKSHIFVGTLGSAREPQDSVTSTEQSIGDWIQNLIVDSVSGTNRPGFAKERESNPFSDEWNVPGTVKRERDGLKFAQVPGHQFRVVSGA
jgi:hypothetical protein